MEDLGRQIFGTGISIEEDRAERNYLRSDSVGPHSTYLNADINLCFTTSVSEWSRWPSLIASQINGATIGRYDGSPAKDTLSGAVRKREKREKREKRDQGKGSTTRLNVKDKTLPLAQILSAVAGKQRANCDVSNSERALT
jgi:hypothetical protein